MTANPQLEATADDTPASEVLAPADVTPAFERTPEHRVVSCLGFFGHYLHLHVGGRSGKQHVVTKLLRHGGSLTQRELLELSPVSSAALSEVLSKLESEGLVTRTRSDQDRRQLVITLTPSGTSVARQLGEQAKEFELSSLDCLSKDERLQLADMLERVETQWKTIEPQLGGTCTQDRQNDQRKAVQQ